MKGNMRICTGIRVSFRNAALKISVAVEYPLVAHSVRASAVDKSVNGQTAPYSVAYVNDNSLALTADNTIYKVKIKSFTLKADLGAA